MTNHPNRGRFYIIISPRGFGNETVIRYGSRQAVEIASDIVNSHVNAWAERVRESDPRVRTAKRRDQKIIDGSRWSIDGLEIKKLHEADVIHLRPTLIDNDGHRYLGGPSLPAGYDDEKCRD